MYLFKFWFCFMRFVTSHVLVIGRGWVSYELRSSDILEVLALILGKGLRGLLVGELRFRFTWAWTLDRFLGFVVVIWDYKPKVWYVAGMIISFFFPHSNEGSQSMQHMHSRILQTNHPMFSMLGVDTCTPVPSNIGCICNQPCLSASSLFSHL